MPELGEGVAEMLVKEMGFTVVSVGYRRAPENVFPTAAHDAIDAVKWVCNKICFWRCKLQKLMWDLAVCKKCGQAKSGCD